jgi:hypothetical protein
VSWICDSRCNLNRKSGPSNICDVVVEADPITKDKVDEMQALDN